MPKTINWGLLIAVLLTGMVLGYWLTPEYKAQSITMKSPHDLGPADKWVDLRYIDGMIAHHLSAIFMLEQALEQSHREEIRDLATAVIAADKAGIESLYSLKETLYNNTREVTEFNKVNLGTNDGKFDLRLVNALLIHHSEAITTAKEISAKSARTEVLNVADDATRILTANADQLKVWRKDWYGIE